MTADPMAAVTAYLAIDDGHDDETDAVNAAEIDEYRTANPIQGPDRHPHVPIDAIRRAERLAQATGENVIPVLRTEIVAGDVWHVYGGWHHVHATTTDHMPHNAEDTTPYRVRETIQARTPEDGRAAWGTATWGTALRCDLAARDWEAVIR